MPRPRPPHVEVFRDRHGHVRVYFRRGKGTRIALPAQIDSPEFEAAYAAALAGTAPIAPAPARAPAMPRTIDALIVSYMKDVAYLSLRPTTRIGYRGRLEMLRVAHGRRTISGMTRDGITAKILAPYADRPGQAHAILKTLRILIRHAMALGWIQHDPSAGIRRPRLREVRSWTDDEIEVFKARWPIGTKQRTAFALFLYPGQRRSDVCRLTWAATKAGVLRVVQQKTGARVVIPMHPELRATLKAWPRKHVTILATEFGRPFTVDGLSGFMRDAIRDAGLPLDCRPHGLRKAAGRLLAEAGCTAHEIMAVLGHASLNEAERYTREANREQLAIRAAAKLMKRTTNKHSQPALGKVGKTSKTRGKTR